MLDESAAAPPARAGHWAMFLDADGTLLDIAPTPDAVAVPASLIAALKRLSARLGGAVAIVSGRPISTLATLFGDIGLTLVGQHGAEIAPPHADWQVPAPRGAAIERARQSAETAAARWPFLTFEDKGIVFALHYRDARAELAEIERIAAAVIAAGAGALETVYGRRIVEFVPAGTGKGAAVERLMTRTPFSGRVPVFAGDDIADEAGFAAANRFGGLSIRTASPERRATATAARHHLAGPAAVRAWIEALAAADSG